MLVLLSLNGMPDLYGAIGGRFWTADVWRWLYLYERIRLDTLYSYTNDNLSYYEDIIKNKFPKNSIIYVTAAGKIPYFIRGYRWRDVLGKTGGLVSDFVKLPCFGNPFYLYYTVHTHADVNGLIAEGDGLATDFFYDSPNPCKGEQITKTKIGKILGFLRLCKRPEIWEYFGSEEKYRAFCASFEKLQTPKHVSIWRRVNLQRP